MAFVSSPISVRIALKSCFVISLNDVVKNVFPLYRKALEDLGIPCFLGGMSRGMLGKDSPIHIRQNRRDALKDADLVLLAGQAHRLTVLIVVLYLLKYSLRLEYYY